MTACPLWRLPDTRSSESPATPPAKLREFRERDGLTFSLLADEDHAVHDAYGAWGEKMNYGKRIEGVLRSTFVIDPEGRIVHAQYNVKATGHVARLRRMLAVD